MQTGTSSTGSNEWFKKRTVEQNIMVSLVQAKKAPCNQDRTNEFISRCLASSQTTNILPYHAYWNLPIAYVG